MTETMETKAKDLETRIAGSSTKDEALQNAIAAIEAYMKAIKLASNETERARLKKQCGKLLARAEEIKQRSFWTAAPAPAPAQTSPAKTLKAPKSERKLTTREEVILLEGSKLHGFIFPPWTADPDPDVFSSEGKQPFVDVPTLKLSKTQMEIFAGWKRPSEIFGCHPGNTEGPIMATNGVMDLVQDLTTDCSVVASLCACTSRAERGHTRILSSIVFPYDRDLLIPRISENGKYIFRFHFNGCYRRVIVDDFLPASKSTRTLHVMDRNNPNILWPALMEKAYLKVRGGYDFPGSNSGTDLWVLTGWIPEQIFLQSDETIPHQLWTRIFTSYSYGDVMITVGTGRLSAREEKISGLAGEHDYAVLEMKEVGDKKMLLVKNPWCDGVVWKGDAWQTPSNSESISMDGLQESLPDSKLTPGTFWINLDSLVQNFESLYLNWNPGLFRYRQDHHFSWSLPQYVIPGSFAQSPQYSVTSTAGGPVWILLSRHFSTAEHDILVGSNGSPTKAVLGFISLYVFDNNGYRVFLSEDVLQRGVFVDSPQTLMRVDMPPSTSYTIVAAQQDLPLSKHSFTLSAFSTESLSIAKAIDRHPFSTIHQGAWTSRTAGGNATASSYPINPQYALKVPSTSDITLFLEADQAELAIHVKLVWAGGKRVTVVAARDLLGGSGDYRRGCAFAEIKNVSAGLYTIVCSTFEPGQLGNFSLRVAAMCKCEVRLVSSETAGRLSMRLPPAIFQNNDRVLAPLRCTRLTRMFAIVTHRGSVKERGRAKPALRVSIERGQGPEKDILAISCGGEFSDAPMGVRSEDVDVSPDMGIRGGLWLVVERAEGRVTEDLADVEILSDGALNVDVWGLGEG